MPANPDGKGVILGEGKPENQNASIIYCFNEALQTIDMNQVRPTTRLALVALAAWPSRSTRRKRKRVHAPQGVVAVTSARVLA